jgi:hypothetical protein
MSCGEIRERHLVGAANFGIQLVNLAGESVWWKPFGHCVRIQERAIDSLRRRTKYTMKSDGVCRHAFVSFRSVVSSFNKVQRHPIVASNLRILSAPVCFATHCGVGVGLGTGSGSGTGVGLRSGDGLGDGGGPGDGVGITVGPGDGVGISVGAGDGVG